MCTVCTLVRIQYIGVGRHTDIRRGYVVDIYIYTSGVKMVSTKTSGDVRMVPLSSSYMKKATGRKRIGTRRGIP